MLKTLARFILRSEYYDLKQTEQDFERLTSNLSLLERGGGYSRHIKTIITALKEAQTKQERINLPKLFADLERNVVWETEDLRNILIQVVHAAGGVTVTPDVSEEIDLAIEQEYDPVTRSTHYRPMRRDHE